MDEFGIAYEGATLSLNAETLAQADPTAPIDCIIVREGWGSSGYYGANEIESGVGSFLAGTRSFMGHPKDDEEEPAHLTVGVMTENARFVASDPEANGKATMRAPISFFSDAAPKIRERAKAKAIALSLRAPVRYAQGEREGRWGRVVTRFDGPAFSVDVVARAGAGGAFGVMKESGRPGQIANGEKEGSEMPLTQEEIASIARETATAVAGAVASALETPFKDMTSALGALTTARENAPAALSARDLTKRITDAKLPESVSNRIWTAVESAPAETVVDSAYVDALIAREAETYTTAFEAAKAEIAGGRANLEEGEEGTAKESAGVSSWKLPKAGEK